MTDHPARTRHPRGASTALAVAVAVLATLPVAPAGATAGDPGVAQVNLLRSVAGLPPVASDPMLARGAQEHARYTAETGTVGHTQQATSPYATPAGAASAAQSNVSLRSSGGTGIGHRGMVDHMHLAPFHGLLHLQPRLGSSGTGYARVDDREAVVIDVRGGFDGSLSAPDRPIAFPGPGSTTTLRRYPGGEYPDPLSSCSGWQAPTGAPVIVTFPDPATVRDVRLTGPDGHALATCWYDSGGYTNADPTAQDLGRALLDEQHALIVIPRDPLADGRHRVLLDLDDLGPATWSFTVGASLSAATGTVQFRPVADEQLEPVCPASSLAPSPFDDVGVSDHAHAIACGVSWDLLSGTTATAFSPGQPVTRGQTATMLLRLLDAAGDAPAAPRHTRFPDLGADDVHRDAVDALAGAGILDGRDDGTFGSADPVTRAQFVSAVSRTLEQRFDHTVPATATARFADVPPGSMHHAAVEHLAGLGIVAGVSDTSFGPGTTIRRDQAASLLLRTAAHLAADGTVPPPD